MYTQLHYLQRECRCALVNSDESCDQTHFLIGSLQPAAAFFLQVPQLYANLGMTLLYILILGTYSKLVCKKYNGSAQLVLPSVMLERCPQVDRVKITFGLLSRERFVFTITNSMLCKLECTENPCLFEKYTNPTQSDH